MPYYITLYHVMPMLYYIAFYYMLFYSILVCYATTKYTILYYVKSNYIMLYCLKVLPIIVFCLIANDIKRHYTVLQYFHILLKLANIEYIHIINDMK